MADPPVALSQPPTPEFLYNWLQALSASATPGGAQFAIQYAATTTTFGGVGPLTNGQLVIGRTGLAPVAGALTAGYAIAITLGAGSITVALGALTPIAAPASPASGWVLYTDSGDGNKLKAKASTGTVVTLGTP